MEGLSGGSAARPSSGVVRDHPWPPGALRASFAPQHRRDDRRVVTLARPRAHLGSARPNRSGRSRHPTERCPLRRTIPVLHFDEDERVIACVLDTARRLTPHVDRMTSLDRDVLAVECDHPLPCRYEPMLGPMFVTLMERRGPKWLPGASPFVLLRWCRRGDLNPHVPQRTLGPQPSASTKFRHSDEACSAAREPTTSSDRAPGWIFGLARHGRAPTLPTRPRPSRCPLRTHPGRRAAWMASRAG